MGKIPLWWRRTGGCCYFEGANIPGRAPCCTDNVVRESPLRIGGKICAGVLGGCIARRKRKISTRLVNESDNLTAETNRRGQRIFSKYCRRCNGRRADEVIPRNRSRCTVLNSDIFNVEIAAVLVLQSNAALALPVKG